MVPTRAIPVFLWPDSPTTSRLHLRQFHIQLSTHSTAQRRQAPLGLLHISPHSGECGSRRARHLFVRLRPIIDRRHQCQARGKAATGGTQTAGWTHRRATEPIRHAADGYVHGHHRGATAAGPHRVGEAAGGGMAPPRISTRRKRRRRDPEVSTPRQAGD
eukprot:scaffold1681_cov105-Isochrysis_galbana.AAC.9